MKREDKSRNAQGQCDNFRNTVTSIRTPDERNYCPDKKTYKKPKSQIYAPGIRKSDIFREYKNSQGQKYEYR